MERFIKKELSDIFRLLTLINDCRLYWLLFILECGFKKSSTSINKPINNCFIMTFSKMNNTQIFKGLLTSLFVLLTFCITTAQVQFKLTMLEDGETYQVSMIPQKSWAHPYNITSTAQVTVKVPSNSFEVDDLKSLQLGVDWQSNSRSESPVEALGTDYISFGLGSLGTVDLSYEAGVEMPLFSFKNALPCSGSVSLMNNEDDPFMAPNSRNANVGNSITIFGARGEAYVGNITENSVVPCQTESITTSIESNEDVAEKAKVYPNPAINEVFVDLSWTNGKTEGDFVILDATGRTIKRQAITLIDGFNQVPLSVEQLTVGLYSIELQFDGQTLAIDRFVKGNK